MSAEHGDDSHSASGVTGLEKAELTTSRQASSQTTESGLSKHKSLMTEPFTQIAQLTNPIQEIWRLFFIGS